MFIHNCTVNKISQFDGRVVEDVGPFREKYEICIFGILCTVNEML